MVAPSDETLYRENIENIINFLKGRRQEIIARLNNGMKAASAKQQYERAAVFRDQIDSIMRLEGYQKVQLYKQESFDVISLVREANKSAVNVFGVRAGKLIRKNTFTMRHVAGTSANNILRQFLLQFYGDSKDTGEDSNIPDLVFIPFKLTDEASLGKWIGGDHEVTFHRPQRGKKRQLMKMGEANAIQLLDNERADFEQAQRGRDASQELANYLGLKDQKLNRIESYDISNIQGSLATGSMVVFTDGNSDKKEYRKFKIKGMESPNDFAMLQQVARRRFADKHNDWPKPDLVLIDGGKGQLSAVGKIFSELEIDIPLVAVAKREEEIFIPDSKEPIRLPYDSDALYLVQRMRDEAHRFTISYHRNLRSKKSSKSLLDEIPGVGPATKKKLIRKFGSLKAIKAASLDELEYVIGKKANSLKKFLEEH